MLYTFWHILNLHCLAVVIKFGLACSSELPELKQWRYAEGKTRPLFDIAALSRVWDTNIMQRLCPLYVWSVTRWQGCLEDVVVIWWFQDVSDASLLLDPLCDDFLICNLTFILARMLSLEWMVDVFPRYMNWAQPLKGLLMATALVLSLFYSVAQWFLWKEHWKIEMAELIMPRPRPQKVNF